MDQRHEEAGGEPVALARALRHVLVQAVVDHDRALLADGAAPRRVLGQRWIRVELLDRAGETERVAHVEVRGGGEEEDPVRMHGARRRRMDGPDELV